MNDESTNNRKMQEGEMFVMNLDKVLEIQSIPSSVKLGIYKAKDAGYLSFEKFLRELSDKELLELDDIFSQAKEGFDIYNTTVRDAYAIAATLAQLEGVFVEKSEQLGQFFGTACIGIALEGLSRKGLVNIKRENLNFLAGDDPVVELTEKGRMYSEQIKKGKLDD